MSRYNLSDLWDHIYGVPSSVPRDSVRLQQLAKAVSTLSSRRLEKVISLRYGLISGPGLTHKEIAKQIGVSPARAQQIVARGLRFMRKLNRKKLYEI